LDVKPLRVSFWDKNLAFQATSSADYFAVVLIIEALQHGPLQEETPQEQYWAFILNSAFQPTTSRTYRLEGSSISFSGYSDPAFTRAFA
jgi:hypothetical protein